MGKYCDPKELVEVWWGFMLASKTPSLENVRCAGLLFTKDNGDNLDHCITTINPHHFSSHDGKISSPDLGLVSKLMCYPLDITLAHQLMHDNFLFEKPILYNWDKLSIIIYKICCGIVLNFRPPSEDYKNELIHEAFATILMKIRRGKLIFDPNRSSPPFNLLTTAIFRVMYSIKNKEKREREHKSELINKMLAGVDLPNLNSIRVSKSLINDTEKIQQVNHS